MDRRVRARSRRSLHALERLYRTLDAASIASRLYAGKYSDHALLQRRFLERMGFNAKFHGISGGGNSGERHALAAAEALAALHHGRGRNGRDPMRPDRQ